MELIRDNWTKNDYDDFVEELRSYAEIISSPKRKSGEKGCVKNLTDKR